MKNILKWRLAIAILFCTALLPAAWGQSTNAITNIKGDLYRFQHNAHYSVFLVTSDGIVVTDPISKEAAAWLSAELKKRFDVPIKYLIYSHDHADHISGGEEFGDNVMVVGHRLTKEEIINNKRPAVVPDVTFSKELTLNLGGQAVQLIYPGKSHSNNCIIVYFPKDKVVFVVDFITVSRLPYTTMNNNYMPDLVNAIRKVEELDFDIVAPGHAGLGTKQDVVEHREYVEDLHQAVSEAIKRGMSLEEMKTSIKLDKYSHFGQYEAWLPQNIEGMHRIISESEEN